MPIPNVPSSNPSQTSEIDRSATPIILGGQNKELIRKWSAFSMWTRASILLYVKRFVTQDRNLPMFIAKRERRNIVLNALKKQLKTLRKSRVATQAFADVIVPSAGRLEDILPPSSFLTQLDTEIALLDSNLQRARKNYDEGRFGEAGYVFWLLWAERESRLISDGGLTLSPADLATLIDVIRLVQDPDNKTEPVEPDAIRKTMTRFCKRPENAVFVELAGFCRP